MNVTAPAHTRYDVVVVGSGLGGLSAAAFLAKAGKSVLVVEQADAAGGYAHAFKRGPYTFDPAVHRMPQAGPGALPEAIFQFLGMSDIVEFLPEDLQYGSWFPHHEIRPAYGFEEHVEAHAALFPAEAGPLRAFFELCRTVHSENHQLPPRVGLSELDELPKRFPTLFRYLRATVAEVLEEFLTDPELKSVCANLWPYLGTPPSRASFVTFAINVVMCLESQHYCKGSFESLVQGFVHSLCSNGAELVLSNGARSIVLEGDRATGVELEGGERVGAGVVISNADSLHTFEDLVGFDQLPRGFVRRLQRMRPSCSAVVVTAATTLDLEAMETPPEAFVWRHYDHEETWRDIERGVPGGMWAAFPTLHDKSLAPEGEHTMTITSLARHDIGTPWKERAETFTQEMLDDYERVLPGLRDSLTFLETATPDTLQRYCRNQAGAIYGWDNIPEQTGSRRSPHQTPVDGLLLAGHWTQPGTASLRVIVSGLHTATMVLVQNGEPPPDLEHSDAPPAN